MHKKILLESGLVLSAFLIRLYAIVGILPFNSVRAGVEYQILVLHLLLGDGWVSDRFGVLEPTAQMPPGLTVLLFICKMISVEYGIVIMQCVQALFAAGTVLVVLRMPGFRQEVRWLAGVIMAFHPGLIFETKQINDSVINGFFLVAVFEECLGAGKAWALGALLGLGALIRPVILVPGVVAVGLKVRMRQWAIVGLIIGICLSPWIYRNWVVFGRVLPFGIQSGYNLYQGWHPESSGTQYTLEGKPFPPKSAELQKAIDSAGDEWEKDHVLKEEAISLAKENPWQWMKSRMWALFYFWFPPGMVCCAIPLPIFPDPWWMRYFEIGFTIMAFIGVLLPSFPKRMRLMSGLAFGSLWLFYGMTHASVGMRYRFMIEPMLCLFAAEVLISLSRVLVSPLVHHEDGC